MRIDSIKPKSSFLSMEKDINLIIDKMLNNERLKRLLYYTSPDALERDNLNEEQTYGLIGKNIKNVPKLYVDGSVLTYVIVTFDNFTENSKNPEFRDNIIEFDIICHFDQWQLKDMQLRPYKIAAEIDSMIDNKHLTGIGLTQFLGAKQIILNSEFGGLCLMYQAIHGEEDRKYMTTSQQEERFLADLEAMKEN